jgi:acetyltransferase-like isoleucine patch superfamily enzyme
MKLYKNKSFLLLLSKAIKVGRIKIAWFFPTLYGKLYLSMMNCAYGKNLKICGKVYFRPNGTNTIVLGENVTLVARFLSNAVGISNPMIFECIGKGIIEIGNNSGLTSCILSSRQQILIGNNVNIGGNVRIFDHDFHSTNYIIRRNKSEDYLNVKSLPVIIEDDVFIGTNAILLKGVRVGARSIIAAGSVVSVKDIPPDSLVAGNPAIVIKSLI